MRYIPHKYQDRATDFIMNTPGAAVFMEQGLGKSVCILTAFDALKYDRAEAQSMLVVAPLRVAHLVWKQEAAKWDHTRHLKVRILHGADKAKEIRKQADIYVINYDGLKWLRDTLIARKGFPVKVNMLVFDESTQIKNPSAIRSKIGKALALGCDRVVSMTGTPTPNSILDMWHQIYVLDAGERLGGSFRSYRAQYFIKPEGSKKYFPRRGVTDYVSKKISDISLVMKNEDYLTMPDKIMNTLEVCLPEKNRVEYDTLERDFFITLGGKDVIAFNAASLSMKLRQYVQGFMYNPDGDAPHEVHTKKLEALQEIVEGTGSPVLVAIQFQHEADMIREIYPDAPAIYGKTKTKDTIDFVERWNKGLIPVMLAHPASIAHGVNLQAGGSTIVWFGITWNLEHYLQFNARLHRQGQERSVMVHHLVMKDTIDAVVMNALQNKEASMAELISKLIKERG